MNAQRQLLRLASVAMAAFMLFLCSDVMAQTTPGEKPTTGVKPTTVAKSKAKAKAKTSTAARARASRAQAQARYNAVMANNAQGANFGNFNNQNFGGAANFGNFNNQNFGYSAYAPYAVAGVSSPYSPFYGSNGYGYGYGYGQNGYAGALGYNPQYQSSTIPTITPNTTLLGGANVGIPVQGGRLVPGYGVIGGSTGTPVHGGTLVPGYGVINLK